MISALNWDFWATACFNDDGGGSSGGGGDDDKPTTTGSGSGKFTVTNPVTGDVTRHSTKAAAEAAASSLASDLGTTVSDLAPSSSPRPTARPDRAAPSPARDDGVGMTTGTPLDTSAGIESLLPPPPPSGPRATDIYDDDDDNDFGMTPATPLDTSVGIEDLLPPPPPPGPRATDVYDSGDDDFTYQGPMIDGTPGYTQDVTQMDVDEDTGFITEDRGVDYTPPAPAVAVDEFSGLPPSMTDQFYTPPPALPPLQGPNLPTTPVGPGTMAITPNFPNLVNSLYENVIGRGEADTFFEKAGQIAEQAGRNIFGDYDTFGELAYQNLIGEGPADTLGERIAQGFQSAGEYAFDPQGLLGDIRSGATGRQLVDLGQSLAVGVPREIGEALGGLGDIATTYGPDVTSAFREPGTVFGGTPEEREAARMRAFTGDPSLVQRVTDPLADIFQSGSQFLEDRFFTPEEMAARNASLPVGSTVGELGFADPTLGTVGGLGEIVAAEAAGVAQDIALNRFGVPGRVAAGVLDAGEAVGAARSEIDNAVRAAYNSGALGNSDVFNNALAAYGGDVDRALAFTANEAMRQAAPTVGLTAATDALLPRGPADIAGASASRAGIEIIQEGGQQTAINAALQSVGVPRDIAENLAGAITLGALTGGATGAGVAAGSQALSAAGDVAGRVVNAAESVADRFVPRSPTAGQPAQSTVDTAYEAQSPAFRNAVAETEFDPDAAFARLQTRFPGAQRAEGFESLAPSPAYEEQVPAFRSARAEAQRAQATADLEAAADIIDAGMNSVGGVEREATFRAIDEATGGRLNIDDVQAVLEDRMAARGATEAEGLFGQPRRADDFTSPFTPVQPTGIQTLAPTAPVTPVVDTTSPFTPVASAPPPAAETRIAPAAPSDFDPEAAFERLQARFPGARLAEGIQTLAPSAPTAPAMDTAPTAPAPSAPPPAAETRVAPAAPAAPTSLAPSPWPLGPPPSAPPPNASAAEREAYRAEREERIRQVDAYMEEENAKKAVRDNALTVLRGARTAQLSGSNQVISKSDAQALVDAGLLSPEDALVPVVANARARELLDLGPDGVYERMTSQPVEVEVEEQAAAPTTRPEVEETVEVEVEEQAAAPTTRPVPRPEVEETVEVETAAPAQRTAITVDADTAMEVEPEPEVETAVEVEPEPEPEIEVEPPEEPPEEEEVDVAVDEEEPLEEEDEEEEEVLEEEEEPAFECPPGFRRVQMANGGFTCVPEMARPRVGPLTQTVDVSGLQGRTVFRPGTRRP